MKMGASVSKHQSEAMMCVFFSNNIVNDRKLAATRKFYFLREF